MKKLLLVGVNSVHTFNYYDLIRNEVDDVVLITDKRNEEYLDLEQHLVNFGMRNLIGAAKAVAAIRKIINRYKPDLIHVHLANSCAYYTIRANKKWNCPVVVTAWGSEVLVNPQKSKIIRGMLKYIVKNASAFTVDAIIVDKKLREIAGDGVLNILHSNFGVEIPATRVAKDRIFYCNRLHEPNYRIEKVIIAFKKFPDQRWRLRIAGSGSMTETLKALCERMGIADRVDFLGWLGHEENYAEYAKATVYVSVPESDATSISVLEALANGCLAVTSNLPAMKEWIKHGTNGFLVADVNSDFLTDALKVKWGEVERINRNMIMQNASKEICARKFASLYDQLLS